MLLLFANLPYASPESRPSIHVAPIVSRQEVDAIHHVFTFQIPDGMTDPQSVSVAGSFNSWNMTATQLKQIRPGTWQISLSLTPGIYQYKFVLNGKTWQLDPNGKSLDDGNGNTNSVISIEPSDYKNPALLNDGIITQSAVFSAEKIPYLNFDQGLLQFRLRARPNDIAAISLETNQGSHTPMKVAVSDPLYCYYKTSMSWDQKSPFEYWFKLQDGDKVEYYGSKGLTSSPNGNKFMVDSKAFKPFIPPTWVQNSVIYQLFTDRFADGDLANDEPGAKPWNTIKNWYGWAGGDFAGVQQHENYLKSLGISCIYFNPIFDTSTYHGYETRDYLKIDPHLGTNAQFAELTKSLKEEGIRTVVDGVFNHTSTQFFAFKDVVQNELHSKYLDWYHFYGFPVVSKPKPNYEGWWGYASLPKLNNRNPAVRKYLLNIPKFWDENATMGGWRLDAANEIPIDFWRQFRNQVKGLDPDQWIVGEFWGDATPWLQGDAWDSTMNYPFCFAVWSFVGKDGDGKATELAQKLNQNYNQYVPQVSRNLMNLVDSHDTIRILTECGGSQPLRNLAAILEFGWVGTPTIYNGDELGMEGGKDPDNRNPIDWSLANEDNKTLQFYKSLVALRNSTPELRTGSPKIILADDAQQTIVFSRSLKNSFAIVAVNRSNESQTVNIKLKKGSFRLKLVDGVSGQPLTISMDDNCRLTLPALTGAIYVPRPVTQLLKNSAETSQFSSNYHHSMKTERNFRLLNNSLQGERGFGLKAKSSKES